MLILLRKLQLLSQFPLLYEDLPHYEICQYMSHRDNILFGGEIYLKSSKRVRNGKHYNNIYRNRFADFIKVGHLRNFSL